MDAALPAEEKNVSLAIGIFMAAVIAASTVLHHLFPQVLSVPPNDGVNFSGYLQMFLLDLVPIGIGAVCFYHALGKYGRYGAMMFLGGSFFFTGLAENVWVLLGRYHLISAFSSQLKDVSGTYYFTRGFFWWGEIPAVICLSWFFIAYACVHIADVLLPRLSIWVKAALGGFLALSLDLWLDPVQVHPYWQSWKWISNESIKLFSIPLSNFAGWFLVIGLFAVAFDRLPRITARWGVRKGSGLFFLLLIALKAAVLALLMVYGVIAMKYVVPPVNFTLWGV